MSVVTDGLDNKGLGANKPTGKGLVIGGLSCHHGKQAILNNVSLEALPAGKLSVVLGPNGAGKSSLFRCLAGLQKSQAEVLSLNDSDLTQLSSAERLARVCYMPQHYHSEARLTVFELVLLAYKNLSRWQVQTSDLLEVERLLHDFDIAHLSQRYVGELSGGQQQMVALCQALCRRAELYMLDEPTSALDLGRQLAVMTRLQAFAEKRSAVVLLALHDLSLAAGFAEHALVLDSGRLLAQGQMTEVLDAGVLDQLYGIKTERLMAQDGSLVLASRLAQP